MTPQTSSGSTSHTTFSLYGGELRQRRLDSGSAWNSGTSISDSAGNARGKMLAGATKIWPSLASWQLMRTPRYHHSRLYLSLVKTDRSHSYVASQILSSLLPVQARCPRGIIGIKQTIDRGGHRLYVLPPLVRLHIPLRTVCLHGN